MSTQNPSGTTPGSGGSSTTESLSTPVRKRTGQVTTGMAIAIGVVLLAAGLGGGYFLGAYLTKVSATTIDVTEAGSTLLEPLMDLWGPNYTKLVNSHVIVSPGPGGSTIGQTEAEAGTIDIGGSDAYVANPKSEGVVDLPVAISSQLIVYDLSEDSALNGHHLNLNGTILAEIYEGTITNWDDPAIVAANPSVTMPNEPITPVVRSDGGGDTFLFSTYCDMSYAGWTYGNSTKDFIAPNPTVPGAQSGSGNSGEIGALLNYTGSVGYVGVSYMSTIVNQSKLQYAAIGDNAANTKLGGNVTANASAQDNYILWNSTDVGEDASLGLARLNYAADGLAVNIELGGSPAGPTTWSKGGGGTNPTTQDPDPYPIVNLEYTIVKTSPANPSHQAYVVDFLEWAISYGNYNSTGQESFWIHKVGFLPLTAQVQGLDQEVLSTISIAS